MERTKAAKTVMTMAAIAVMACALAFAGQAPQQQSYAQYGVSGNPMAGASDEQLAKCKELDIDRSQCNEHTILAKERVKHALETTYGNKPEGSGTALFKGNETWVYIGVLGAIFGGVATAFFARGRSAGAKPAA
ncbi:MAG: hypothetical protein C4292_02180 [Nitrososphaera sp.]